MIVIISHATDLHARAVRHELERRAHPVVLLDVADLGAGDHLTFREGDGEGPTLEWLRADGERVDLGAATAIWHRRIATPRVPACDGPTEQSFAIAQWQALLVGALEALPVSIVNRPLFDVHLEKPHQLAVARAVGLRIPRTVITSEGAAARAFVAQQAGEAIHKPLTGSAVRMLQTRRYDAASDAALDGLALAPEIFQEAICGGRELRITVVGAELFAAEFRPAEGVVDGRTDLDTTYVRHELPPGVAERLRAVMRRFELVYATIDMKLTDDGEYVFLELNPQGQFLYIEILTGMPIAAAVADLLVGMPSFAAAANRLTTTQGTYA